jgi:hypothetical protein
MQNHQQNQKVVQPTRLFRPHLNLLNFHYLEILLRRRRRRLM